MTAKAAGAAAVKRRSHSGLDLLDPSQPCSGDEALSGDGL
jgi:hypothetical protein